MSVPQINMKAVVVIGMAVAVAFYVGWRGGYMPTGSVTETEKSTVKRPGQMQPDIDLVDSHLAGPVIQTESPEVTRKNPVRRALTQADQELKQKAEQRLKKALSAWELSRTSFNRSETEQTSQVIAVITAPTETEVDAFAAEMTRISDSLSEVAKTVFDVEAAKKLEDFTNFPQGYKVAIRVLDVRNGAEENWYYKFNHADPTAYDFKPNGELQLPPGVDLILNRKEWDITGPEHERLAHLFPVSGED